MDNNEENSKPIKKKKIDSKKTTKGFSSEEIQKLLKEALIKSSYEKLKNSNLEIESMVGIMEEFLKAFIVIGYDLDDNPVCITNAKTRLDADALYTSLVRLFASMSNQQGGL